MKKRLLSAVLSGAMLLSAVPMVHAEEQNIDVFLNGEFVEFADQAPAMINDRTLVPIRAVVEKMGATVGWDEAAQTATVSKGETNLALTIDDPSITVNGEKKPLDVAPALINNRTMLPIRAVVEELGCSVGWDDDLQTVIIMDWNAYVEELKTNAPGFYEYMANTSAVNSNYVSLTDAKLALDFAAKMPTYDGTEPEEVKFNVSLGITSNESMSDSISKSENVIKADLASIQELLKKFAVITEEQTIDLTQLDEVKLDVIAAEDTIYVKTNIVKKLADVTGEKSLKSLAMIFNSNTWMKITFEDLAEVTGMSADELAYVKMAFAKAKASEGDSVLDVFIDVMKSMEYDFTSASAMDTAMDMYTKVLGGEGFKYEKAADGSFKVSMNIDNNTYIEMMKSMGVEMSAEELAEFGKMFNVLVSVEGTGDANGNCVSVASFNFSVNVQEEGGYYVNVNFDMDMSGDLKVGNAEAIALPEESIDLMNLLGQASNIE